MDYFMIRQSGTITIPKAPPEESAAPEDPSVRAMIDLSLLDKFDYLAMEHLFSDPLKQVIEQYLPEQLWRPCVFIHPQKKEQKTFWFLPPLPYQPKQVTFASNGLPAAIAVEPQDFAKSAWNLSHPQPERLCIHCCPLVYSRKYPAQGNLRA